MDKLHNKNFYQLSYTQFNNAMLSILKNKSMAPFGLLEFEEINTLTANYSIKQSQFTKPTSESLR